MKIWVMLCSVACFWATAQKSVDHYEGFGVNKKYGLVDNLSGEAIIAPQYDRILFDFNQYVALKKGNVVDFYSKETGEKLSFKSTYQSEVTFKNEVHYYYQDDSFGYLIPSNVANRVQLPKKYDFVNTIQNLVIGFKNNVFDVYEDTNVTTPKVASIKASQYHFYPRTISNKLENVYVFYGLGTVYVYNETFVKLKEYKSKVNNDNDVMTLLKKDFPKAETKEMDVMGITAPPDWKYHYANGVTKVSKYSNSQHYFYLTQKCEAQSVPGSKYWVEIQLVETGETYQFRVDFEQQHFYLPQKYIQSLGLKFEN